MSSWFSEITESKRNVAVIVLSFLGLLVSLYISLFIENGTQAPGCSIRGTPFDCESVINSSFGSVFGIPVADLGVFYFLVVLALFLVGLNDDVTVSIVSLVGLGSILYFIAVEFYLGKFCLYCTTVHIIVVIIFILVGPQSIKNTYLKYKEKS